MCSFFESFAAPCSIAATSLERRRTRSSPQSGDDRAERRWPSSRRGLARFNSRATRGLGRRSRRRRSRPTLGRLRPRRGAAPPVPGRALPVLGMPGDVRVYDAPFHGSHRAVFGKDWGLPWGAPDFLWEGPDLSWEALYLSCAPMGPDQGSALPVLYTPGARPGKRSTSRVHPWGPTREALYRTFTPPGLCMGRTGTSPR